MICSMCTGGGRLLRGSECGSTTFTPPFEMNHSLPSDALTTGEVKWLALGLALNPSSLSKTVTRTHASVVLFLCTALVHASISAREIRARPQCRATHVAPSLSSMLQDTPSHGSPCLAV